MNPQRVIIEDGYAGSFEIWDTDEVEDVCVSVIQILEDTVFAKLKGNANIKGISMVSGVVTAGATYIAGDVIYGRFSKIQLASGAVRCYNQPAE